MSLKKNFSLPGKIVTSNQMGASPVLESIQLLFWGLFVHLRLDTYYFLKTFCKPPLFPTDKLKVHNF